MKDPSSESMKDPSSESMKDPSSESTAARPVGKAGQRLIYSTYLLYSLNTSINILYIFVVLIEHID